VSVTDGNHTTPASRTIGLEALPMVAERLQTMPLPASLTEPVKEASGIVNPGAIVRPLLPVTAATVSDQCDESLYVKFTGSEKLVPKASVIDPVKVVAVALALL
jgi:hypothetical protein